MMEDRNITKMDIEYYLLNREYNELTSDELAIVKEFIDSEQEFNEMKAVIMGVGSFFEEEKELEPNPAIKAVLMKEFDKQQPARIYWLNGIFVSLFPKEKKLYQRPGFQLIGMAASILLIITVMFNTGEDLNPVGLAQNDDVISEDETVKQSIETKTKDLDGKNNLKGYGYVVEQEINPTTEEKKDALTDFETLAEEPQEEVEGLNTRTDVSGDGSFAPDTFWDDSSSEVIIDLDDELSAPDRSIDEVSLVKQNVAKKELTTPQGDNLNRESDKLLISGVTEPITVVMDASSDYREEIQSVSSIEMEDVISDLPLNSRTLEEDADLIGILYTAL